MEQGFRVAALGILRPMGKSAMRMCKEPGLKFRVQGLGFRVQGFGFRVDGFRVTQVTSRREYVGYGCSGGFFGAAG